MDRPNRFGVYDSNGLVYSTGWKGFANYPGPWGSSLNTNTNGSENVCFTSLTGRYVQVDVGSADPANPVSDYFTWDLSCLGTCPGASPTPSVTATQTPTPTPTPTPPMPGISTCQAVYNPNAQVVFVQYINESNTVSCNIVAPNETIIFCVMQGSTPIGYADFPCGTGGTLPIVVTPQGTTCTGIGECYPSEFYPITVYQGNTCDCLNLCIDANR